MTKALRFQALPNDARPRTAHALQLETFAVPPALTRALRLLLAITIGAIVFCPQTSRSAQADANQNAAQNAIALVVPGTAAWADTGIDVVAGQPVSLRAEGSVFIGRSARGKYDEPAEVGPEGTYLYNDKLAKQDFPLAAAGSGPAPCFCLMGRIGDGEPFYVGRAKSWKPAASGRLYLGVNDFDPSDNEGQFVVSIFKPEIQAPIAYEQLVPIDVSPGAPVPGCSVVVFYLDGLRPDVIREMAAMGHIPNINRLFVEGGVWLNNAFTGFPSDTITSNGTMWTGCFSDRHGLKGQVCFSRRTLESKSYLDPMGPSRSARELVPQGLDRFMREAGAASVQVVDGEEAASRYRSRSASGIPPLYEHLRHNGDDWSTGALPVMSEFPPVPWSRSLTKYVPYLQYHESWRYMDEANTDFAKNFLFEKNSPVTVVWLPETDSVSHHDFSRGQFGTTRRTIARADVLIGQMLAELEARHRLDRTYFILCSDHGHHGGQTTNLSHFDLGDEFFYKPRLLTPDGRWVGGGLGLSVRQHRFWNRHPEDRAVDFVFLDADQDGTARVFLPNREYRSGAWYGKPRPGDLLAYRLADNVSPIDLIGSLTGIQALHGDGTVQRPIDLVLTKLSDDSILISTHERGHAVITRRRDEKGKWLYKYTVVDRLQPTADGGVSYAEVRSPQTDPLGLVEHLHPRLLTYEHDETDWLRLTTLSKYPDSVVALTRHMLWQENLAEQELEHAPDLVVTARAGWYFGIQAALGTTHGYPLPDSMHASLFISGPNVRPGSRIVEPCRLADLTPTILNMIGYQVETGDFDGHPLRNIYQTAASAEAPAAEQAAQTGTKASEARAAETGASQVHPAQAEASEARPAQQSDASEARPAESNAHQARPIDTDALEARLIESVARQAGLTDDDARPARQRDAARRRRRLENDAPETRPVYWEDVDLKAWKKLDSAGRAEYEHLPLTVHHPYSSYDLHNVAYDALSISDFNVLRFFDDALSPLNNGQPIVTQAFGWIGDQFRHSSVPAISQAANVLDVSTTTIGDYSFMSAGNMKRMDGAIDWLQSRAQQVDSAVSRPFGLEQSPGMTAANKVIDGVQWWFWDAYQFGERVTGEWLDEKVLSSIQDATDRALNQQRLEPAEKIVEEPNAAPAAAPSASVPPAPAPAAQP